MSKQLRNLITMVIREEFHYGCPISNLFYQSTHLTAGQTLTTDLCQALRRPGGW